MLDKLRLSKKFTTDVLWNVGSFGIMGFCALVVNLIIAIFYDVEILGVFNQVHSIYILFSQITVFGIHLSVLKYISEFAEDQIASLRIICAGLILTALTAGLTVFVLFIVKGMIGRLLESPGVGIGLFYALGGMWAFSMNKVLLAILNARRKMRSFAFAQASRYILQIVVVLFCIRLQLDGFTLPVIFTIAEISVLVGLMVYIKPFRLGQRIDGLGEWFRKHFFFGMKAFAGQASNEINTRIDVFMLGFFSSDRIVGIYSIAATCVEGINQLMVVVRANVNPILTALYTKGQLDELKERIATGTKYFYLTMAAVGIVAVGIYPLFIRVFLPHGFYMESWPVFSIIMVGIILSAGYFPFNMLLSQTGFPGKNTLMIGLILTTNIILNLLLIPSWLMAGAALATAITFVLSVFYLKFFVRKSIQLKI